MSVPLSIKQKKFIEKSRQKGQNSVQIANSLGISVWTVRKWIQRQKKMNRWNPNEVVQLREL